MAALPDRSILDGSGVPTTSAMKTAMGSLRDYLAGLLGADGTAATARTAIGTAPQSTRIDVASVAGTVDLTTAAPNTDDIRITGALAITGFTASVGRVFRVTAGGAFTLINGASLVTQTGANIVAVAGDTFMLRATEANVVEVLNYVSPVGAVLVTGNQTIAGVKTFSSQPVLPQAAVLATSVATTSGTAIDFTSIPSWVKRITLILKGVSTNGSSYIQAQIGSGSVTTSGYVGAGTMVQSATPATVNLTTGFCISNSVATSVNFSGIATIFLLSATTNTWAFSGMTARADPSMQLGCGVVTLAGTLDRIRLTTVNGTDTFDAGSVNILYE